MEEKKTFIPIADCNCSLNRIKDSTRYKKYINEGKL